MNEQEEKSLCPTCNGTGKEICDNPDHGFIDAVGGETGRLGCPCCGHSEDHVIPNTTCEICGGTGFIPDPDEKILDLARQLIQACEDAGHKTENVHYKASIDVNVLHEKLSMGDLCVSCILNDWYIWGEYEPSEEMPAE